MKEEGPRMQVGVRARAEKQELSCVNVVPLLAYLGQKAGEEKVPSIVEPLGLPLSFLKNKSNWISFEYYNRLLKRLVQATGDEEAPFRAAFSVRPQEVYDYILYAAYATLWSGSPRAAYALSLGSSMYRRWTKIGDFEILGSSPSSMKVALALKEGYTQTRQNCRAVQGILASVPLGMGLPPADIQESECAANGAPRCVYQLRWRNKSNGVFAIGLPVAAALIAVEAVVFPGAFPLSSMIITALSFTTLTFLLRGLQFWRSLRQEEYVSLERNEHMVKTMARIEGDYARLQEAKTAIDDILASIPAFVLIFDATTLSVKYVNRHFLRAFPAGGCEERSGEQVVGMSLSTALCFTEPAMQAIEGAVRALPLDGKARTQETTQGSLVYEYSLFSLPDDAAEGRLAGIIITDISDAKYFQNNLLINQKLLALGRVASGIAHEINNPLYAVLANAEEIADDTSASGETRVLATEIVEHAVNVSNVIKDLSNYSKTLRREEKGEVDVNAVIEESLLLVRYGSNLMQVQIAKALAPLPPVRAAKGEIQQVLINIIDNAIRAMDGKGTLTIRTRLADGGIEIAITDTGKGIREEDIPFIYDLFFSTKGPGQGTGQGLYIVRKILSLNDGTVSVRSAPGAGLPSSSGFRRQWPGRDGHDRTACPKAHGN